MKRALLYGMILAVACPVLVLAQSEDATGRPKAAIDSTTIDLGTVREGHTVTATYTLHNIGDAPLKIVNVRTSCGCTTVELSDEEKVIAPGKSQVIEANFDTAGRPGKQSKRILVMTNDPDLEAITLGLEAEVIPLVLTTPPQFLNLGQTQRGGWVDTPIDLFPYDEKGELEIIDVQFERITLAYELTEIENDKGRRGYRLRLQAPSTADLGRVFGMVMINARVGAEEAVTQIRVAGEIVGELTAVPMMLQSLMPTPPGRYFQPVVVSSSNDTAFNILKVDVAPAIECEIDKRRQGREYQIRAKVADNAPNGPFGGMLKIFTDRATQPLIELPIFVNVAPRYQVDPKLVILFANDSDSAQRVLFGSVGADPVKVTSIDAQANWVTAQFDQRPEDGAAVAFRVSLTPGQHPNPGDQTEVLIHTDIPGAETIRLPVEVLEGSASATASAPARTESAKPVGTRKE